MKNASSGTFSVVASDRGLVAIAVAFVGVRLGVDVVIVSIHLLVVV
jgi:hypothetical protein